MWGIAVILGSTLLAFVAFAIWQGRLLVGSRWRCASCGGDRVALTPTDGPHTYEVLACTQCTDVITTVQGQPSRFAPCPTCRQFALEVEVHATGPVPVGEPPPVDVQATCRICGHHEAWSMPEWLGELPNNVIEFPRR